MSDNDFDPDPDPDAGDERPRVLLPVRVLEGDSLPEGVPELLARAHVVLLGYHAIPEQTAPGQARMQFEERALRRLDAFEEILVDAGATVERRLVFTHEPQKTVNRTIYEYDCLAVLVPNATGPPEEVLVAVRGTVGVDRLVRLAAGLFGDGVHLTLYHVAAAEESDADAGVLLDEVAGRLVDLGVDSSMLERRIERDRPPVDAIADAAEGVDAVVMGETDPSLTTLLFGMPADQVAERFLGPVFVVQRALPADDEPENEDDDGDGNGDANGNANGDANGNANGDAET